MSDVLSFSDIKRFDYKSVGNKALNLALLMKEKYKVPEGFVVTTRAFEKFIFENGFNQKISELLNSTNFDREKSVSLASKNIQGLILTGDVNKELREKVQSVLRENQDTGKWAVRSSALAEDLDYASFAGQQDSFLNVDSENIIESIKLCWASYWNKRALVYRENAGISHIEGGMAVLVQKMINADVSGVMFTADPISGDKGKVIIESSWGLGESIVSGSVSPDRFILEKWTKEVIERDVGEKLSNPSLSEEDILSLIQIGQGIESYFKVPQDIEWAINKDGIFILQSRGITTIDKDQTLWTRGYSDEYWADVTSPLFFSLLGEYLSSYVFKEGAKIMGYKELKNKNLLKLHKGHVYFNAQALEDVFTYNPKIGRTKELLNYFPKNSQERIANARAKLFRRVLAEIRVSLLDPDGRISKTDKAYKRWADGYMKYLKRFDRIDLESLTDKELHKEFLSLRDKFLKHYRLIRYGMVTHSIGSNLILKRWLESWLDDRHGVLYSKLITGLEDNKTILTNLEITKLSKEAKDSENVSRLIRELTSEEFLDRLEKDERLNDFSLKFKRFIDKYGHRSHTREIYFPRWRDDPTLVIEVLKSLIDSEGLDLEELERRKRGERLKAEADILGKISKGRYGAIKRPVFKKVLGYAQRYLIFRENQRFYLDHELLRERRLFLEYGRRFRDRGILDADTNIFFLSKEEIFDISNGKIKIDKEAIKSRKDEFERYRNVLPPKFLKGSVEFDDTVERHEGLVKITGTSSSPGISEGKVRVLESVRDLSKIEVGEILVTSNTDPGWTPVFSKISALITETGGILSHGAVVSREYGIPAVTAVSNATKIFKNGQRVKVDGNEGFIYLEGFDEHKVIA